MKLISDWVCDHFLQLSEDKTKIIDFIATVEREANQYM